MVVTIRWYHVTRALGVFVFLYGLLVDESPDRGMIILTGAGMAGFDKVARTGEGSAPDPPVKRPTVEDTDSAAEVK